MGSRLLRCGLLGEDGLPWSIFPRCRLLLRCKERKGGLPGHDLRCRFLRCRLLRGSRRLSCNTSVGVLLNARGRRREENVGGLLTMTSATRRRRGRGRHEGRAAAHRQQRRRLRGAGEWRRGAYELRGEGAAAGGSGWILHTTTYAAISHHVT